MKNRQKPSRVRPSSVTEPVVFTAGILSVFLIIGWWLRGEQSLRSVAFARGFTESLVEDVQTLILLLALVLLIRLAVVLSGRQRLISMTAAALALLLILEEISWGQQLFGWATPSAVAQINAQNETTLHNLIWFQDNYFVLSRFNVLFAIPAFGGMLLGLGWAAAPRRFKAFLPTYSASPFFLFAALVHWGYALQQSSVGFFALEAKIEVRDWEIAELFLYTGLLVWVSISKSTVLSRRSALSKPTMANAEHDLQPPESPKKISDS